MLMAITPDDDDADQDQKRANRHIGGHGFTEEHRAVEDGDDIADAEQRVQDG